MAAAASAAAASAAAASSRMTSTVTTCAVAASAAVLSTVGAVSEAMAPGARGGGDGGDGRVRGDAHHVEQPEDEGTLEFVSAATASATATRTVAAESVASSVAVVTSECRDDDGGEWQMVDEVNNEPDDAGVQYLDELESELQQLAALPLVSSIRLYPDDDGKHLCKLNDAGVQLHLRQEFMQAKKVGDRIISARSRWNYFSTMSMLG